MTLSPNPEAASSLVKKLLLEVVETATSSMLTVVDDGLAGLAFHMYLWFVGNFLDPDSCGKFVAHFGLLK